MTKIWVGFSESLGFRDLIPTYIDPFYGPVEEHNDDPVGLLELEFGASPNGPGSFEAYEKTPENEQQFGLEHIMTQFPFEEVPVGLRTVNWSNVKTVFFIMNDKDPKRTTDGRVSITDVLDVKFDWE
ncbi:hypothetical protein [Tropicibacter naphthalenivorans]|uniref:Uncharacterized protein n=1 Tax=Tropicibacter naphthalenivorans TaxID=441103 RepID=A0A0P1GF75_9RHOB|nr:hypothetical protein [Tropicibacter naphthalenivorans]CUH80108.1 hypothetical protein TRN7648_02823 [Tropicibacter naphthalenivorans]SMC84698.1 hypothetical protein SAMN04488093_10592 [Tropicibacter naphthalenivorans]